MLTKETLINTFEKVRREDFQYLFVNIVAEGVEEVIVVPRHSLDAKEKFYTNAYTDDLKHVMNKDVYIKGMSYGSAYELDNIL